MFKGSFVALVTPFRDGKVDEKTLHALLDFHLKNHTDGIVPCGTTGESATMSHDEHKRILSLVVEHVAARVPVVCGAGSNCTEEALGLIQHAKAIKAQGVLVVTPYYNRPTQEGLFRHYEFLAKKVDIPFVIYNVPARTGVSITPETVARLSRLKNIVAIKEASGSLEQVSQILNLCNITVLSGDDPLNVPMIAIGAKGVISVTANVVPRLVHDMTQAALDGNFEKAKKIHYDLLNLSKSLFLETNPIPVKYALKQIGKISGELRLPLCEMSKPNADKLRDAMRQLKLVS